MNQAQRYSAIAKSIIGAIDTQKKLGDMYPANIDIRIYAPCLPQILDRLTTLGHRKPFFARSEDFALSAIIADSLTLSLFLPESLLMYRTAETMPKTYGWLGDGTLCTEVFSDGTAVIHADQPESPFLYIDIFGCVPLLKLCYPELKDFMQLHKL